jgi:glucuronoarabinoxylan endo-1,4-beta-xylanase
MKMKISTLVGILTMAFISLSNGVSAQTVNIDLSKEHQIIRGFGGIHINSWTGQQLNADMQKKAFSNNPGEMGLTIFRLPIDPNPNLWVNELAIAKYAVSQGALIFASPWNPPSHMRQVLRVTQHGTDYVLLEEYYDDYAQHLNNFIAYMENNGVPLYAVSVQNEPDWHSWTWWEPAQMLKFVREHAHKINSRVIAPESLGYVRRMIDPLLNDSVANSHIDILGTHLYGTPKANFYYPLAYEKNKEIWMTEHLMGSDKPEDNTWSLAMALADEINLCMDARMSAFVYWYIRRFYGLIDDSGNITDKGYVMSQFSKFIKPGSYRVETNYKPANKVTATAYKSDSTFVIVVVNENNQPVNLNFNIENLMEGIDAMSKFTTSATKRINNDGAFDITGGGFSASVDAFSITTFTSDASKGGKFGNLPPVATGGGDISILDSLGTALSLTLKGSESYDPDGHIVNYSWAQNGYQISTSPDIDVSLRVGEHTYVLTVTDNDGATASETVNISIKNLFSTEIWFEAECAKLSGNWDIVSNSNASNGKYLTVKQGVQATGSPSANANDHLVYKFNVTEGGNYIIWGRVLAPSWDDDSFWVKVNDGEWVNWNGLANNNVWQWNYVYSLSSDNQMIYQLDPGEHTLYVCYREDGAGIDKLYITNTGKVPAGLGGNAETCVEPDEDDAQVSVGFIRQSVKVYPNPVRTALNIVSDKPFSSLIVYNLSGHKVIEKTYNDAVLIDELLVNLQNGMYLLHVTNASQSLITKFVVDNNLK